MFGYDKLMGANFEKNSEIFKLNDWFGEKIFVQKIFSTCPPIISLWNIILKWAWRTQAWKQSSLNYKGIIR